VVHPCVTLHSQTRSDRQVASVVIRHDPGSFLHPFSDDWEKSGSQFVRDSLNPQLLSHSTHAPKNPDMPEDPKIPSPVIFSLEEMGLVHLQ
jgi:hypothetical protein